jgi:ADP-ribose pyrophosphatase
MARSTEPTETVWEGQYLVAKKRGRWEFVARPRSIRAAVILAFDGDKVILVEQYREPMSRPCIELPAGLIGDEDGAQDEDDAAAATRELEEETGYRAGRMEFMGEFYSSPGMMSESFSLFRAQDLERVGDGGGGESEDITVHRVSLADLPAFTDRMRARGMGIDVRVMALLMSGWNLPRAD